MSAKVLKSRPDLKEFEIFKEQEAADENQTQVVLNQKHNWDSFVQAQMLTPADVGLLKDYDKQPAAEQAEMFKEHGVDYAVLFARALHNFNSVEVLKYLLVLLNQALEVDSTRAQYFVAANTKDFNPYAPIVRMLSRYREDQFIVNKTCHILSVLFAAQGFDSNGEELREFIQWFLSQAALAKTKECVVSLSALKHALVSQPAQEYLIAQKGLRTLMLLLKKDTQNTQLVYNVVFCIWRISFSVDLLPALHDHDIVNQMTSVLQLVVREKVVRITTAVLRNLLDHLRFNEEMIVCGVLKVISNLSAKKWSDAEMIKNMQVIEETLQSYVKVLSTFDRYHTEVMSGSLRWTPVHNEKFWREHITKFDEDSFTLIKQLVKLLEVEDEVTIEVACYDLGEFARLHPDGRRIVDRLGGKRKLMARMNHANPKVSKMALLSVQKLMIHNWESLSAPSKNNM